MPGGFRGDFMFVSASLIFRRGWPTLRWMYKLYICVRRTATAIEWFRPRNAVRGKRPRRGSRMKCILDAATTPASKVFTGFPAGGFQERTFVSLSVRVCLRPSFLNARRRLPIIIVGIMTGRWGCRGVMLCDHDEQTTIANKYRLEDETDESVFYSIL